MNENITFEEVKDLFKQAIDNSNNMNEALSTLANLIWQKGYDKAKSESVC